jgi:hypothetical protein
MQNAGVIFVWKKTVFVSSFVIHERAQVKLFRLHSIEVKWGCVRTTKRGTKKATRNGKKETRTLDKQRIEKWLITTGLEM